MKIVFHLGYPRTGSTFLQTHVFPEHKEINFLGPKNYLNWQDVKINQDTLNKFRDFYLLNNQTYFTNDIIKYFDKEKINIISSEHYLMYNNTINNFYDCKYIEQLFQNEELEISFLIVLRNQYDLINSFYHHKYPYISEFLKIKNFEKLVYRINDGVNSDNNNFPLKLFLDSYDFNLIDIKLKKLFKNIKIKYLFYEDLKYHKNIFIDEFCDFLTLDREYTESLFNEKLVNKKNILKNNQLVISPLKYKITTNKYFVSFKNKFPFKIFFKKLYLEYFVYTKTKKINDENRLKHIVKEYFKLSNKTFFKNTKLKNKFDY